MHKADCILQRLKIIFKVSKNLEIQKIISFEKWKMSQFLQYTDCGGNTVNKTKHALCMCHIKLSLKRMKSTFV